VHDILREKLRHYLVQNFSHKLFVIDFLTFLGLTKRGPQETRYFVTVKVSHHFHVNHFVVCSLLLLNLLNVFADFSFRGISLDNIKAKQDS